MGLTNLLIKWAYSCGDYESLLVCLQQPSACNLEYVKPKYLRTVIHPLYYKSPATYLAILQLVKTKSLVIEPFIGDNMCRYLVDEAALPCEEQIYAKIFKYVLLHPVHGYSVIHRYGEHKRFAELKVLHGCDNGTFWKPAMHGLLECMSTTLDEFKQVQQIFEINKIDGVSLCRALRRMPIRNEERTKVVMYMLNSEIEPVSTALQYAIVDAAINAYLTQHTLLLAVINKLFDKGIWATDIPYIHYSVIQNSKKLLKGFLKKQVNIDHFYADNTALHYAAHHKQSRMVKLLVKYGASCTAFDAHARVPLVLWYIPHRIYFNEMLDEHGQRVPHYEYPMAPNMRPNDAIEYAYDYIEQNERYHHAIRVQDRAPQCLFDNTPIQFVKKFLELDKSHEARSLFDYIRSQYWNFCFLNGSSL